MTNLLIAFRDELIVKIFIKINNLRDCFLDKLELMLIVVLCLLRLIFTDLNASHQLVYLNSQHNIH